MPKFRMGVLQVYTGDGKGKTTAAIGQAVRAVGQGLKVYMIQFMKGKIHYGELKIAEKLHPKFVIEQFGRPDFVDREKPAEVDFELAEKALAKAKRIVKSGKWDMVILDEVNVALDYGLIKLEDVIELVRTKPKHVELVFTGRNAVPEIICCAELVSEVREIKHPFRKKFKPRAGIEY